MNGAARTCGVFRSAVLGGGLLAGLLLIRCASVDWAPGASMFEEVAGLSQPALVAFNPEDDLTARVTPDSRYVAFVSERNGNLDVWVRDYGRDSTYPLTQNPADDFDPALFPNDTRLVFVSRRSDAKGDLFVASGLGPGASVQRLTDATTQDRQPVVAPDGRRVFFTAAAGIGLEFIAELSLDSREVTRLSPTSGFDPAVAADGRYLIYTAPAGPRYSMPHLVALRLTDNATRAVTAGETPAGFATFLPATSAPYGLGFVRFPDDDNEDGVVDARDQASLWRVDVDLDGLFRGDPPPRAYPLTDGGGDELFPDAGDGQLYFTQGSDQQDILRLPATGVFPVYDDPALYLDLADVIDDPRTRWFALRSAVGRAGPDSEVGASALLRIGRLQLRRGASRLARRDFGRLIEHCRAAPRGSSRWTVGGLAEVEAAALDRRAAVKAASDPESTAAAIASGRRRIEALSSVFAEARSVMARIELERAELLIAEGERTRAIQALEAIGANPDGSAAVSAQAMLRRIELLGIVHDPEALAEAYAQVTRRFPDERAVVDEAASRLVAVMLEGLPTRAGAPERVDAMRRLVGRYPIGAIRRAARWRLAGELRESEAFDAAALELAQLAEESSGDRLGTARALRALAEVDEARGAGGAAVEGWRRVLQQYADLPGFGPAARTAISRVNLSAAAASEARGDDEAARRAYRRVIDNDEGEVEAHRRYLALSARLQKLDGALDEAKERAARSQGTPVARYAYGVALTWQDPPDLDEALDEVEAAISLNPQFTEAYLLRGWIREMQELEEPSWFVETLNVLYERVVESVIAVFASDQEEVGQLGRLELAIEDYKTALRLNNEALHPRTEAEILLNLANGHYRLADATNDPPNMNQAFLRYSQVLALGYRFETVQAEMVFWERFGRAGSWVGEHAVSAMATRRALAISNTLQSRGSRWRTRRLQQLGNLALTYDQAGEEAYAQRVRKTLDDANPSGGAAGRAALRLREKARARFASEAERNAGGFEAVLSDLAAARTMLSRLDDDPRELPTLWVALGSDPTSAQYGFGPRDERNVNLALAELTHRSLGDVSRADALARERAALAKDRFDDIPGTALGLVNKWPKTVLQVRERLGLLLVEARRDRDAGRWTEAWARLMAAGQWLQQSIDSGLVSGSPSWLWLERARWCATAAAWRARARADGRDLAPSPPVIDEGFAAVGRALALTLTATAAEPMPGQRRAALWRTARTEKLDSAGSVDTADPDSPDPTRVAAVTLAVTASVARGRPSLAAIPRAARALTARLTYARGLQAWAAALRPAVEPGPGGPVGVRTLRGLFGELDRAERDRARARKDFLEAARLAAGAGPGLGHRVLIVSWAAWAQLASPSDLELASRARSIAVELAEAIGEERLAWALRFEGRANSGTPVDLTGAWPGFFADSLPSVRQVFATTASASLSLGDFDGGFVALDRSLAVTAAAGPPVELGREDAPDDRRYTQRLRAAVESLASARRALAESEASTEDGWRSLWADIRRARRAVVELVKAGERQLSLAAQSRVLARPGSAEGVRLDLDPDEALVMPADVKGRLHLLLVDGSTTTDRPFLHRATDVPFEAVRSDLEAMWASLKLGQPIDPRRRQRFVARVFTPLEARLSDKASLIVSAGYLGRPIPRGAWPEGPVLTHLHSAGSFGALKAKLRVGGRERLRVPPDRRATALIDAPALTVEQALAFRTPRSLRTPAPIERLQDRPPAEMLPDRVHDLVVTEAPLRLEVSAPERSSLVFRSGVAPADAFRSELPLGDLDIPARTLVLGRTAIHTSVDATAALRLDGVLAVAGYPTTVVIPDLVSDAVARTALSKMEGVNDLSPAAALAVVQDDLREAHPEIDALFVVGIPGMGAVETAAFAARKVRFAQRRAVDALRRQNYGLAVPYLEEWIRLQRATGDARRLEGIYGALVGVLRDKVRPPRPARAADVQAELIALMTDNGLSEDRLANAEVDLGDLLSRAQDYEAAETVFARAIATLRAEPGRREGLARAHYIYGLHHRKQKEFEAAVEQLERAIGVFESLGVYRRQKLPAEAKRALLLAGELYLNDLSDPLRARRAYERVKRYAKDPALHITAEIELARVSRRRGDFIDAAGHAEQARAAAARLGLVDQELVAQIEAANVAWYQGDYRLGQQLCLRTLRTADRLAAELKQKGPAASRLRPRTLSRRRTFALSVCGLVAMSQRDFDGAVGYLEEARRIAERLGDDREVATQLNNLGRVYLEFGRLRTAVETFRRAQAIDRTLDDRYALAYDLRNLGRALALLGVRAQAREALEQGLAYAVEVRDANNELRARFALAQLDRSEGRTEAAQIGLARALPLAQRLQVKELEWQIHRLRGRIARDRGDLAGASDAFQLAVRTAHSVTGRSAPSEYAPDRFDAFDDLLRLELDKGDAKAAFDVAEDARRLRQSELLADSRLDLGPAAEALLGLRTSTTAASYARSLAQLRSTSPRLAERWTPFRPEALAARMPVDGAVLQYELTRDALVVFVLTADGLAVRVATVEANELRQAVARLGRQLAARADPTVAAREVAEMVLDPVLTALEGKRRVVLVLQDVLRYVPWPALPIADGTLLIDRVEVVRALDARAGVDELARPAPAIEGRILAIGSAPPPPGAADRPLPFAEQELRVIAEEHPGAMVVRGAAVTRARVLKELERPRRALHYAGHTYLAGRPDAGRLVDLLGGQLRTADGGVTVLDLLQHRVGARMVVLSSCSSLIGSPREGAATGEDILSMAEAMHLAGARAVLGSTLNVDDVTTALLMKRFYRAARRMPVGAALRSAQQTARRLYGHPAWWAGFSLWVGPDQSSSSSSSAAR